jgi:hypothetical protein
MPKTKSGRRQARVKKQGPVVPRQVNNNNKKKTPQRPDPGVKVEAATAEEKKGTDDSKKNFYLTLAEYENDKSRHQNLGSESSWASSLARGGAILELERVANRTHNPLFRVSKQEIDELVASMSTDEILQMACMKVLEY